MKDRLKTAFDQIEAGEDLKQKTRSFLQKKTRGYTRKSMVNYQYAVSFAACFLVLLLGGNWLYFTPTTKISIDVKPSSELSINRFDRVISVGAFNEDGKELAEALPVKFMGYVEAVNQIMDNEQVAKLLSDGEVMTITVVESGGKQSVRILSEMESCTAGRQNTYCYSVDSDKVGQAHAHGMSCGKYRAFLEIQAAAPGISLEEVQDMTMKEIQDLMRDLYPENGNEEKRHHGGGDGHRYRHGWN